MEQKNIIAFVIVLALIVVGMFVFTYLKKSELNENTNTPTPSTPTAEEKNPYSNITRIDAKHFFINGIHTVVGEIPMPTPCDLLNWSTSTQETAPGKITINFSVVNHAEVCTQVVTVQRFKVSFPGPENLEVRATLQGKAIELNLVPAGKDETPEDFELFLKG